MLMQKLIFALAVFGCFVSFEKAVAQYDIPTIEWNKELGNTRAHLAFEPLTSGYGYSVYEYRMDAIRPGCNEFTGFNGSVILDPAVYGEIDKERARAISRSSEAQIVDFCPKGAKRSITLRFFWDGYFLQNSNVIYETEEVRARMVDGNYQTNVQQEPFATYYVRPSGDYETFSVPTNNFEAEEFVADRGEDIRSNRSLTIALEYSASIRAERDANLRRIADLRAAERRVAQLKQSWLSQKRVDFGFPGGPSDQLFVLIYSHAPQFWQDAPKGVTDVPIMSLDDAAVGIERFSAKCGKRQNSVSVEWSLDFATEEVWVDQRIADKYVEVRKAMGPYDFEVFTFGPRCIRCYSGMRANSLNRHHFDPLIRAWGCDSPNWERFWDGFAER